MHRILLISLGMSVVGCASKKEGLGSAMAQAFGPPVTMNRAGSEATTGPAQAGEFAGRLNNGRLTVFEEGRIIVEPTKVPVSLQPTALTADAIITSSLISKIGTRPDLRARGFEVKTNEGVVKIQARQASLDDAAYVINLALSIPEVRQIVYLMPATA
jgi:hypothetical protein